MALAFVGPTEDNPAVVDQRQSANTESGVSRAANQLPQSAQRSANLAEVQNSHSSAPNPELQIGSRGKEIGILQSHLNALLPADLQIRTDNDFGPQTQAALRMIQAKLGLDQNGKFNPSDPPVPIFLNFNPCSFFHFMDISFVRGYM